MSAELRPPALLGRAAEVAEQAFEGWTFAAAASGGSEPFVVGAPPRAAELPLALRAWAHELLDPRAGDDPPAGDDVLVDGSAVRAIVVPSADSGEVVLAGVGPPRPSSDVDEDGLVLAAIGNHLAVVWATARRFADESALAARDPLTGLLNHRRFHEVLSRQLESCRAAGGREQLAVVLFDLDGFKQVNDAHGHAAGDRVLRTVAGALATASRTSDFAFRVGGDEFALILPSAGATTAKRVARRVREVVAGIEYAVGPSFGVASWPADGPTKHGLLARADARLYAAKGVKAVRPVPAPDAALARTRGRLALASRLAAKLAPLGEVEEIVQLAVDELHEAFHYYLAVIQRLDPDGVLRVVASAGPLSDNAAFLAWEQPIDQGVNGRVARTGEPALVLDTRADADYLRRDPRLEPGSELSLPIRVDGRIWGVLNVEAVSTYAFDEDDLLLADAIASQVGAAVHRARLFEEAEGALVTTLATLSDALELKDRYTAAHSKDVADLAERIAVRLGVTGPALRHIRYGALLHDIGKIGVRTDLLAKPGALTPEEYEEIQRHVEIGADLLLNIEALKEVAVLVRGAHEHWDGGGYPRGVAGDAIPLGSRIIAACDAYDAMTTDRPYRAALGTDAAVGELRACSGTHFDPLVVRALVAELAPASDRRVRT
jgi:diguanylate cyclase (GGDEF)-like protein/putative nucleotidyltransferase with HDIG domain